MAVAVAMMGMTLALAYLAMNGYRITTWADLFSREIIVVLVFALLATTAMTLLMNLLISKRDVDQTGREMMSHVQLLERRLLKDLGTVSAREVDKLASKEQIAAQINARIDEALVSTIDEALRKRLKDGAKVVDVIGYIDSVEERVRTLLDGPAGRAEKRSGWLMGLAILLAGAGIFIAYLRVIGLGNVSEKILALKSLAGDGNVWPYVFVLSAPWVTLVALVEFSALMLLKLSAKLSLEQRHYTELLVEFTDRMLALKAVVRFGSADQVVAAATLLIKNNPKVEAKSEGLEESLSAVTKITESLAAIVKQFASKEAKPSD